MYDKLEFLMDTKAILALFDAEQRINIEYPGVRKERRPHVIRFVSEVGASISSCTAAWPAWTWRR